jgi:thioredoxin reductase (NADPH)
MRNIFDVTVIGAGPAGISAAIWCKRLGLSVAIIEQDDKIGGQLNSIHNNIIDYPGLIASNGKELAKSFQLHLEALEIPVYLEEPVKCINHLTKESFTNNNVFQSNYVIFATGSGPKTLGIPGEEELYRRGNNYSTSEDINRFQNKTVAIVGGGDRAFEGALNIADVAKEVFIIHRNDTFKARKSFIEHVKKINKIKVMKNSQVTEIIHRNNKIYAVQVNGDTNDFIPVDFVLIRIGVTPNSFLLPKSIANKQDPSIKIDKQFRTTIPWIFAIGDIVIEPSLSSISTATSQGMIAAKTISLEV